MTEAARIRVTRDEANRTRYELMHEGVKLREVTHDDICLMIKQFSQALIHDDVRR